MASLYLIRHGEPEVLGVLLGQLDPPLSAAGRQAAATALTGIRVEAAWSSPLCRARETAGFINCQSLVELAELKELDQGDWTGKTWLEVEAGWPDLAARKLDDWLGVEAPGGETWDAFLARVRQGWEMIRGGAFPAAVIAHQGVNAALLYLITGRNPVEFAQGYGEVIELKYD
jgi:alpha-ribazole phosphatase